MAFIYLFVLIIIILYSRVHSCGILETPRFGRKSNFQFTPGAIVTFECNEGFFLNGDRRRICGEDGRWDIPQYGYTECLREFFFHFFIASCSNVLCQNFVINKPLLKNEHLFDPIKSCKTNFGTQKKQKDLKSYTQKYLNVKIYRRGLLYTLHRMDCNPRHSDCNLANDYVHCLRCLSISQETVKEGSQLCFTIPTLAIQLENYYEESNQ